MDPRRRLEPVTAEQALPGRAEPIVVPGAHAVLNTPLAPPFPVGMRTAQFAMGCFWGAERRLWRLRGVYTTAAGYAGGFTPNPTYEEVCTGRTGHAETVLVVFDPSQLSDEQLCAAFFEGHDPTQWMRQGNDVGTQYRSAIFVRDEAHAAIAAAVCDAYGERLRVAGYGDIVTEITHAGPFYYAEDYHQQYLAKNPHGYCGLGGTGVSCPVGLALSGEREAAQRS